MGRAAIEWIFALILAVICVGIINGFWLRGFGNTAIPEHDLRIVIFGFDVLFIAVLMLNFQKTKRDLRALLVFCLIVVSAAGGLAAVFLQDIPMIGIWYPFSLHL
ncbi:MAG: hypothetical protein HYT22_01480 [Candidatus Niyogibacteria bacterium]|nr:hypothetical protein [Candidatus Niyogibacteria bacterium]